MRFLALFFCWFLGGAPLSLASEMPEDLAAYLERQGEDREDKTLEEWLEEHGTERPEELQNTVNPLGDLSPPALPEQATAELAPAEPGIKGPAPLPSEQPLPFVPEVTQPAPGPNLDWRLFDEEGTRPSPDATPRPQPTPFEPTGTEPTPSPVALGNSKPLTVTLVQLLAEPSVEYTITGCPPSDPAPLKNDGVSPDTRANDQELTGIVPLCPAGETEIRFLMDGTEVWASEFSQSDETNAPSLRVVKRQTGFSIDSGGPEEKTEPMQQRPVLPQAEQEKPLVESKPTHTNSGFWFGALLALLSILVGWRHFSAPTTTPLSKNPATTPKGLETQARTLQKPLPTQFLLPAELKHMNPGTHWISVKTSTDQRSLTFALALHHCQNKTVFLLANPENKKTYSRAFSRQNDITWLNGKPPRVEEVKAALLELEDAIGVVILEGSSALSSRQRKAVQALLEHIKQPVFIVETASESSGSPKQQRYSVQDGHWRPINTV